MPPARSCALTSTGTAWSRRAASGPTEVNQIFNDNYLYFNDIFLSFPACRANVAFMRERPYVQNKIADRPPPSEECHGGNLSVVRTHDMATGVQTYEYSRPDGTLARPPSNRTFHHPV